MRRHNIQSKHCLIFTILHLFSICVYSQEFNETKDKITGLKTVTFKDQRTPPRIPIIVQKTYALDTSSLYAPKIEIGLYSIINLVATDYFMNQGGYIVFEDNTSILLNEELSHIFLSGGRHQISIKHLITPTELIDLQTKKMKYFTLGKLKIDIDSYEKDFIRDVFLKIEKK